MKKFSWIAQHTERLSSFLRHQLPEYKKNTVLDAIRYHGCRINGKLERFESYRIQPGDRITLTLEDRSHLNLLWEDDHCCIFDKPAHLSTEHLAKQTQLRIVHRLDRDTTGCILLAKNNEAEEALTALFRKRKIQKQYLALVFSHPKTSSGTLVSYVAPQSYRCGAVIMRNTQAHQGKLAITKWSVLSSYKRYTLMLCEPITGRTHQIRLHMQTLGCPIVGDIDYGNKTHQPSNIFRPQLHAYTLSFVSPFSQQPISICAASSGDPRQSAAHLLTN